MPLIARLGRTAVECAGGDAGRYAVPLVSLEKVSQPRFNQLVSQLVSFTTLFTAEGDRHVQKNLTGGSRRLVG